MPDETPLPSPAAQPRDEGLVGLLKLAPIVLVGVALGIYFLQPASPTARTEAELGRARTAIQEKRWLDATPILERIARDRSVPVARIRDEAAAELAKLADRAVTEKASLADVATILAAELDVSADTDASAGGPSSVAPVLSETCLHALGRAGTELDKDPRGASALAACLAPFYEGTELEVRVREVRARAFDARIARDSADVEAVSGRAAIDFGDAKIDEARARLEPVADKLGGGDGARVLGLARLRAGKVDESVALLKSYFEATLPAFERASQGFQATLERAVQRAELDPELAVQYRTLHGDEAKRAAHDAFVRKQIDADRSIKLAKQGVLALAPMVEVALGLAQIEIANARGKSAGERASGLERANRYLDSVGRVGSETDSWWVWFARVRIEQGNVADVETVVDAYVRTFRGIYRSLFLAAELLAEASDLEPARTRAEEAFAKAATDPDRERAAELRARVSQSPEDQLHWLERAGSKPQTAAMIAQARASLALGEGRFDDAAAAFDEARKFYESETGSRTAPPVHAALLTLARAEATGRRADLDDAIARLEAQVKEEPPPLVALDALADALQARASATVVGDRVQSELLRDRSLDLVDFAAADDKEAAQLAQALAANPDLVRSRELRERCAVETPRRPRPYASLVALAWKTRDVERLEAVVSRLQKATLDRTEEARQIAELWSGKRDEAQRQALGPRRKRADVVVSLARASGHAATLASALGVRSALEREASSLGAPADHDLAIKLAEEAHGVAPRRGTRLELRNALLARAAQGLRKESPAFEALVGKYGRVGFVTLLTWAVRADATLPAKLAKNADVERAMTLHAEVTAGAEPQSNDARLYAIAGDPRAVETAARIKASRLLVGAVRGNAALLPEGPEIVNELVNVLEACGETVERAKVLGEAKKSGVPLPYDLLQGDGRPQ